jgi:hypothetical protein
MTWYEDVCGEPVIDVVSSQQIVRDRSEVIRQTYLKG